MYGEKRYSGKCGICAICSRTDYRRGSSEGPLCKIKIKSRAPLRGAYQNQAFAVRTCSKCLAFLFHFFSQIFREIDYFIKFYHPVPRVYLSESGFTGRKWNCDFRKR